MNTTIKGSCLCKTVSYQYSGDELIFQYCHCSRCRKFTGSAFAPNIIIRPEQFSWLSGEDSLGRFEHPDADHFATCFCTRCGSSLPWLSKSGRAMIIPAGTLDDDPGCRPSQNIFSKDRSAWFEEVDSLPHHDALPQK